ncbi:UNVERIFIED_CONTAM: hypothetical protein GTU68_066983 [Idotea baltica]|nr:hypothetical protein [Idotea baltica]
MRVLLGFLYHRFFRGIPRSERRQTPFSFRIGTC